ncbi:MAG: fibronectin type III domain-containing protein, partial [Gammaproteobacteria bacterium]
MKNDRNSAFPVSRGALRAAWYFRAMLAAALFAALGAPPAGAQTPTVSFAQAAYTHSEGSSLDIPVNLSAAAAAEVLVTYAFSGTAKAGAPHNDFSPAASPLTISSGATTANINIFITDEGYKDPGETFTLTLTVPDGYAAGSITTTTVTINDATDDFVVRFNPTAQTINETDVVVRDPITMAITEVPAIMTLEVSHEHPEFEFTVKTVASGESTVAGVQVDFISSDGCNAQEFTFPRDSRVISWPATNSGGIAPTNDDFVEHDESCMLVFETYQPPSADTPFNVATARPDQAGGTWTITIIDDDRDDATIAFGADAAATVAYSATAAEADGTFNVPVSISHAPDAATTFFIDNVSIAGGATEGESSDYTIAAKHVVFPAKADQAARTQTFVITLNADALFESDESILLRLAAADTVVDDLGDYYRRNTAATAQLTLSDSDVALPPALSAHPGDQSLMLVWTPDPAGGSPVTGYLVRWRLAAVGAGSPGDWNNNEGVATDSDTAHAIPSLTNGSVYDVQIMTLAASGNSNWSASTSQAPFSLDVNGDSAVNAADGILIARYLLGVTGAALTAGASGASPTAAEIITSLDSAKAAGALDADGNGVTDWKDGILYARYMLGLRGEALIAGGITTAGAETVA